MNFYSVQKRSSLGILPILLLCFCILFSSCANSQSDVNDHSLYLSDTEDLISSGKTEFFYFLLPKDASAELTQKAKELCQSFCSENGARAQVYFDNEELPRYENSRFILLGNTSHPSSQKAISNLKRDDYICLSIEKDVIIGGKSSRATVTAIERFIKDVLPYFDGESGISEACSFEYFADYGQEDIKINGYSLSDYTLVYPSENTMREAELAHLLREKLADICGAYPSIISDTQADASDRLICVGNCFGQTRTEPQIACEGNSVKLFAASANALAQAVQTLLKSCENSQSITLQESTVIESNTPAIDFNHVFAHRIESESDLADIVRVCKEIKQELPILVCFEFPSDTELEQYKKNLNEYAYIGNGLFVLSDKNEIISLNTEGNVSVANIRIGDGFDYRIVVADTRGQSSIKEILDSAISKISDSVTTVLFTLSKGTSKPSFEREDIILELEKADGDSSIHTSIFSPMGAAFVQEQTIIINHSLLREAITFEE